MLGGREGGLYHLGDRCTMLGAHRLGSRGMSLWRRFPHPGIYDFVSLFANEVGRYRSEGKRTCAWGIWSGAHCE